MAKTKKKETITRQKKAGVLQKKKSLSKTPNVRKKNGKTIKIKKKSAVIYSQPIWQGLLSNVLQVIRKHVSLFTIFFIHLVRVLAKHIASMKEAAQSRVFQFSQDVSEWFTELQNQFAKEQKKKKRKAKALAKKRKALSQQKKMTKFARWRAKIRIRSQVLFMVCSLIVTATIFITAYEVYTYVFKDLPSVAELTTRKENLTTKILDRNGKLLYSIYKDQNRTLIPLSRVPQDMIHATIAIEDRNFYSHNGLSFRGIFRALHNDLSSDKLQGGSTITQQLVKNTLLGPERTLKRKIREALLATVVEGTYSKDEILEMYFNDVPYGGSTYGIEEAAQKYFGKPAFQLDLAESAFLAGIPAAPSVYNPFGSNPEYAYLRQKEVLKRMLEDGYITTQQAAAAETEKLQFRQNTTDIKAPHFVMYVRNLLEQQYGEDVVNQGGLEVRTSLDLDTQDESQALVTNEMKDLARLRISNGAALVTNPKTGEILAMVGSKNYFDFSNDGQVNVTTRPRQPGSSIKPITYAIALEKGKNPSSTIVDAPITYNIPGSPPYSPKNYDGRYHGTVTLRTALGSSFNIPAVKTLAEVGISTMIDKAQQMGISTWQDRKRFGLSLTLGSGEVLMTDMAEVYGTFANYGVTVPLNPILQVKDYRGNVLYRNSCALDKVECPGTRTLDTKVAYQITDILSDNNARTPAFGPRSVLYIPNQQVAVKTGTTNSLRDNWSIGYTTNRLVAVWVGNNDNRPMSYVASGVTGASPIWNKIIRTQLDEAHPHVFPVPSDLVKVKICATSGTLPCSGCPVVTEELFVPGTQPTQACNPAQFVKINTPQTSPRPSPALPAPGVTTGTKRRTTGIDRILQGITTQ